MGRGFLYKVEPRRTQKPIIRNSTKHRLPFDFDINNCYITGSKPATCSQCCSTAVSFKSNGLSCLDKGGYVLS